MSDWSLPYVVRQTVKQFLTPSGLMMIGSFLTTVYAALWVPQRDLTWLVVWNAAMVFNHTGRWILPQWLGAKTNGAALPQPPKGP